MNASSWLRPLQVLAVVLGVALAALLVVWVRMVPPEPSVAPVGVATATAGRGEPDTVSARGGVREASVAATSPDVALREAASAAGSSAVLFGTVRRADGSLVSGGNMSLQRAGKHVGMASLRDGTFAVAGLQPGVHRLTSRIHDERPLDREVVVTAPSTRLDIVLEARWLLTVNAVTPEGAPLLEAIQKQIKTGMLRSLVACASREPLPGDLPPSNHAEVATGVGSFRGPEPFGGDSALPKQTVGILTLPPDESVHVALLLRNCVVAQLPVAQGQPEVTFTLGVAALLAKMATVRMRIVDPQGVPVADATVALNDAQTGGGGRKSDAEGRVTLEHLVPGRLDLGIGHRTLRAPRVQIDVAPGAALDLGDLTLLPGVAVELALDNFGGKGLVRFNCLDPVPAGWSTDDGHVSAENGKRSALSLYPGRYGFYAVAADGVAIVEVDARHAPAGPVRFDLRRGAALRIEYRLGSGRATLDLCTETGIVLRRREVTGSTDETVELPVGTYTATITDAKGEVSRRSIRLTAGGGVLTIP